MKFEVLKWNSSVFNVYVDTVGLVEIIDLEMIGFMDHYFNTSTLQHFNTSTLQHFIHLFDCVSPNDKVIIPLYSLSEYLR